MKLPEHCRCDVGHSFVYCITQCKCSYALLHLQLHLALQPDYVQTSRFAAAAEYAIFPTFNKFKTLVRNYCKTFRALYNVNDPQSSWSRACTPSLNQELGSISQLPGTITVSINSLQLDSQTLLEERNCMDSQILFENTWLQLWLCLEGIYKAVSPVCFECT